MPAWKTFDARTAAALKERIEETEVSLETISQPLFAGGDSVVIAPTLQKGAALVITARRKLAPVIVEAPVQLAPLTVEEIPAPEASIVPEVEEIAVSEVPEPVASPEVTHSEEAAIGTEQTEALPSESDFTFGPTTWERVDEVESPTEFMRAERETHSTDPEIWDLPSQAPPGGEAEEVSAEQTPVATNSQWEEEHYVATGFLGLEDYVENEEEALRAKRPWWKRIFSD